MSKNRDEKILTGLFDLACDIEPDIHAFRVAAALYERGRLISYGFNSSKTDPIQARFSDNPLATSMHAEMSAIKNALNKRVPFENFEQMTMYVARAKWTSKWKTESVSGLAKPCPACTNAIRFYNISEVVYTCDYVPIINNKKKWQHDCIEEHQGTNLR